MVFLVVGFTLLLCNEQSATGQLNDCYAYEVNSKRVASPCECLKQPFYNSPPHNLVAKEIWREYDIDITIYISFVQQNELIIF